MIVSSSLEICIRRGFFSSSVLSDLHLSVWNIFSSILLPSGVCFDGWNGCFKLGRAFFRDEWNWGGGKRVMDLFELEY